MKSLGSHWNAKLHTFSLLLTALLYVGPPRFSVPPTNTDAFFGQDVVLQCVAVGPPEPVYSWTRTGSDLPDGTVISSDSTRLLLFSVTNKDQGTYQCTASNELGLLSGQAQLTVSGEFEQLHTVRCVFMSLVATSFSSTPNP